MTTKFTRVGNIPLKSMGDEISDLLRDAADCVDEKALPSACWRVADAAMLLCARLERNYPDKEIAGLNCPTSRGGQIG